MKNPAVEVRVNLDKQISCLEIVTNDNVKPLDSDLSSTEEFNNINEFLKSENEEIKVKEVKTKSSPFSRGKDLTTHTSFMSFRRVETVNTI